MALEAGDHNQLPEAVFVVAQAKRVAGVLRIDISQQISDLQDSRMMRKSRRSAPPSPPRRTASVEASPSARGAPPARRRRSLGRLLLIVLAGGVVGLTMAVLQRWLALPPELASADPRVRTVAPAAPDRRRRPGPEVAPDQLLLRSGEPSWLEVRDAAGGTLFRGTFTGEKRFPLGSGLRVLAGRPDLVNAAVGDGQARPLGPIDQVVWHTFKPAPAAP